MYSWGPFVQLLLSCVYAKIILDGSKYYFITGLFVNQGCGNHMPDLGAEGNGQVNFLNLLARGLVENSEPYQFSEDI